MPTDELNNSVFPRWNACCFFCYAMPFVQNFSAFVRPSLSLPYKGKRSTVSKATHLRPLIDLALSLHGSVGTRWVRLHNIQTYKPASSKHFKIPSKHKNSKNARWLQTTPEFRSDYPCPPSTHQTQAQTNATYQNKRWASAMNEMKSDKAPSMKEGPWERCEIW